MAKRFSPCSEPLFLFRRVNLSVWADCKAPGALVYAYLRDWIKYNEQHKLPETRIEGRYWVYKTVDEIRDGIGRLYEDKTIRTALNALVEHGYLIRANHNRVPANHTKYYALDRDPDQPPSDDTSPESAAVFELKRAMDRNSKDRRLRPPKAPEDYVNDLMAKDYSDTYAEWTFYDEYERELCFVKLSDENRRMVLREYVERTLRKGDTPNFKHFVTKGVQQVLANIFGSLYLTMGESDTTGC